MEKAENLRKVFPVQEIEDNCIISGNGDITFGFSLLLPEAYCVNQTEADSIHDSYVSLLKLLPGGTIVHKQDFIFIKEFNEVSKPGDAFTKKANLQYLYGRPQLRHYSNLYITVPNKFKFDISGQNTPVLKLSDFLWKRPFSGISDQVNKVQAVIVSVENSLKSIAKLKFKRLGEKELQNALYDYVNLSYDSPCVDSSKEVVQPYSIEDNYLRVGNKFAQVLTMISEGDNLTSFKIPKTAPAETYSNGVQYNNNINQGNSMMFPIGLGFPVNHIVNTVIQVLDTEELFKKLKSEETLWNFPAGLGLASAKIKVEEMQKFRELVAANNYTPCRVSVNVIIHHHDLNMLKNYVAAAETAFQNMNDSRIYIENEDTLNLFMSNCPGAQGYNYRLPIITSTVPQAVCYLIKESNYYSEKTGNMYLDRTGSPVIVDLWTPTLATINNRNLQVYGPSGSGKSFFSNGYIEQCLYGGNHVVVIDIGRSYEKLVKINGGIYFDAKDSSKLSFNIFLCTQDKEGNYLYRLQDEDGEGSEDKINFIATVIFTIWKAGNEISPEERTIMSTMIVAYYEYINKEKLFPTLIEFSKFISIYEEKFSEKRAKYFDFESLRLVLEPYVSGERKTILNSRENIDLLNEKLIVFELEAIKDSPDLFNLISTIIVELVVEKIKRLPLSVRKNFIIDEALDFLTGDIGDFIAYLYRTFRKKNGSVGLFTQTVEFLESATKKVRDSILANSDIKVLLYHKGNENLFPGLVKYLSLTENEVKQLEGLIKTDTYREFLLKMGSTARVYRYEVSPAAGALYSTTADEVAKIEQCFEKSGSMAQAIMQYLENKNLNKTV
jgi:conjugation system TraG family ATPase